MVQNSLLEEVEESKGGRMRKNGQESEDEAEGTWWTNNKRART